MLLFSFLEIKIQNWRSFEKKGYFWPIFQLDFFSHQGKDTKIPSAHISLTYRTCTSEICAEGIPIPTSSNATSSNGHIVQ